MGDSVGPSINAQDLRIYTELDILALQGTGEQASGCPQYIVP